MSSDTIVQCVSTVCFAAVIIGSMYFTYRVITD